MEACFSGGEYWAVEENHDDVGVVLFSEASVHVIWCDPVVGTGEDR